MICSGKIPVSLQTNHGVKTKMKTSHPEKMDTMLTPPDFNEDSDRDRDDVFNVAPGRNNSPLSIFREKYSKELCFNAMTIRKETCTYIIAIYVNLTCR